MIRRILLAALLVPALCASAWAIQPGTSGTEKRFQEQGLRSGVLLQKNNTATATAGAATLNAAGSGVITSESLTTAAGSEYTLTLTNNMVEAGDVVLAATNLGTATTGNPTIKSVTPAAGSVVIVVGNSNENSPAAFNGTIQVRFMVMKQNANGSD